MQLLPNIKQFFVDSNGDPLAGGKLYSYAAGTSTPQATYTDASGGVQNANPLILDASGQGEVWIDPSLSYKFQLQDTNGVIQWTRDSIQWIPSLSVATGSIAAKAVTQAKIADAAVGTTQMADASVTTNKLVDSSVTTAKIADGAVTQAKANNFLVPTGAILPYGGTSAPAGFLLCDGTSYLRATYPNLATVLGASGSSANYGAADSTHFNVPDLRGRFIRGWDNGQGNDPDAGSRTAIKTGGATGDNVGSLQADQYASHSHAITLKDASANGTVAQGTNGVTSTGNTTSQAAGGNETRPKNVNVTFIIKT